VFFLALNLLALSFMSIPGMNTLWYSREILFATGFAAGVGRSGELCGAITGAILGLGLKYGRNKPHQQLFARRPYWYSTEFIHEMQKKQWKITCKEILELDISETEARKIYNQLDHWNTTCREIIKDSTDIAWNILQRNK